MAVSAGREMDALIAEKVMGWVPWVSPVQARGATKPDTWRTGDARKPTRKMEYWHPSKDIAAAWEVVDKMQNEGYRVRVEVRSSGAYCDIIAPDSGVDSARERTAPLAICVAALRCVETVAAESES